MDTTHVINDDDTRLYQSYIGILKWTEELGKVDLCYAADRMACF